MQIQENKDQRRIRVFISSTFRDMQAERDELVKRIFPQLRKLCESRRVTWGEVDLRWGVTDEQKAEGRVLPICLEEIRRCRPYFIGLLGERYGWIPGELPPELVEREPWLSDLRGHSVTELEILHGVLNDPGMAEHTFFYFRDPAYLASLPSAQQELYSESPAQEELQVLGIEEARCRAESRRQKLGALKQRIRQSGLPLCENYPNPAALGELVLHDLQALIDRLYPAGEQPDPLEREAAGHASFALNRRRVYIGRQAYFARLDTHVQGDGLPLVVLGESGSGKSALLANWGLHYMESHPDAFLILHFIGATPGSADWTTMLRRILGELKQRFVLEGEIPDQPDLLRAAFANGLNMAAARGRVVLVLDGINQLEERQGALDLTWLPPVIPANVRLILSTLPGRPLEEFQKRGLPVLQVEALGAEERRQLIGKYLAQFSKTLGGESTQRIAAAPQAANPLYLRVLLDELRLFGVQAQLDERIGYYLEAASPDELYEKVLGRCEQDYERDRPGLVRSALTLLWAARRGLSEIELLEMLGAQGQPLPGAFWSPLSLALEGSLLSRGGLIGFAHPYLRQAVQDRYLTTEAARRSAHMQVAGYFNARELDRRKVDEQAWQLAQAQAWQPLYDLLTGLPFFKAAWDENEFEVKAYWARLENDSNLRMVSGYKQVLDSPGDYQDYVITVSKLLRALGHVDESQSLGTYLIEHYRQSGERHHLQAWLGEQALILYDRGDLDGALALDKEEELICRELGHRAGVAASLVDQANILQTRGMLDEALRLQKEGAAIFRELGYKQGLAISLGNQGLILYARGDLDGAMRLNEQGERLAREMGDKDELQRTLANQAAVFQMGGSLDQAMTLYKEEESLCRELGNKAGLQRAYNNQASILITRGDLDGAMALYLQAEWICRELGNKDGLQTSLGLQANIHYYRGNLEAALALRVQQERLCRELQSKFGLQTALGGQAIVLHVRGDLDRALVLYKEQEQICRELGSKDELRVPLSNQGLILNSRGDLAGALVLFKEEESLSRALGNKAGLTIALDHQALVLKGQGDLDGAMLLYHEAERICRELGNKEELRSLLGGQGMILYQRGDLDGAMQMYTEEARLCRALGNRNGLQISLGNQGNVLYKRGDLDGAMALYQEQEQLCRALGKKDGLGDSLINQALILKARGDRFGALRLHREEEQLCRELGDKIGLQASFSRQAKILVELRDLERAMAISQENESICRELGRQDHLQAAIGDQADILFLRSDLDAALVLYRQQEQLCRALGVKDDLATSLANQAMILGQNLNQPQKALPLAEEACRLASAGTDPGLVERIQGIRSQIHERLK
jgi:tetratricopeptide (TPR) repeat protein